MAEFVVSSVLQTIGKPLIHEAKFLWGVEGKIEDLYRELKLIQCLLRDADAKQEHDQAVRECVAQLRDIAYDAEDVIEQYILRVVPKKEHNIVKAYRGFVAKCACLQVHVVGTEIDGLRSSISNLRTSMLDYGIQPLNEGEHKHARASTRKLTYAHFEEDLVGREDSIKVLVNELLKDGEEHRVISICGMGGLGKTTLAKKVLAHDKVKNHFDGFAWACVSQEYHVRDILEEILVQLMPDQREGVAKMRDDELSETLYMTQKQKRCIVCLDNIWTKQAWDSLQAAFPFKDTRSKLLITTRNKEVAEYIDPQGFFHEPRCLSNQESWDLLRKRAFLDTEVIDENMKRLGDKLLKKCGGLPLAVIVLAGILAVNRWETVYENINLYFRDKTDVPNVLALSYDDLSWHLKPCFLYLGSFPEDVEIPVTKVLHMWIAEGFVSLNAYEEEREIAVEDVAKQYLAELVNRGMVQVRFNLSGKIKTCHLHNLMRDLCVSRAKRESFLSIINIQQHKEMEDLSSLMASKVESTSKMRRLSLNMCLSAKENMILTVKPIGRTMLHLRTLMFLRSVGGMPKQFQSIFNNCKFLRVLKLEGIHSKRGNLPESVGDLVLLRYLSLARSLFKGLPKSMGNLVLMEFLDLELIDLVEVIMPNVLWKMRSLRHLHLPIHFAVDDSKKLRLDSLKNLQTLRNFHPKNCDVFDVGKQINLQKLTICNQNGWDEFEIILPQLAKFTLKHLQSSSFRFTSYGLFTEDKLSKLSSYPYTCKLSMKGKIEKLPEHKNLPQQLRKLILMKSQLEEDPMPILEKLHHLVVLLLEDNAFLGREMICSEGGFPQLKHLALDNLQNLEEWRVAKGAMPHLSRSVISKCFKLKTRPVGVCVYDGAVETGDEQNDMTSFLSKEIQELKEYYESLP